MLRSVLCPRKPFRNNVVVDVFLPALDERSWGLNVEGPPTVVLSRELRCTYCRVWRRGKWEPREFVYMRNMMVVEVFNELLTVISNLQQQCAITLESHVRIVGCELI